MGIRRSRREQHESSSESTFPTCPEGIFAVGSEEQNLVGLAEALNARQVQGLTLAERALLREVPAFTAATAETAREQIREGLDPLGEAFCRIRSPLERRPSGATYTPATIVQAMVAWARNNGQPVRVVDPGAGSGRFAVAAGRAFPAAQLVAMETDPLAALLARAHLATAGFADRSTVLVQDYRQLHLPVVEGPTLFIGNPPYVRHHDISPPWKNWLMTTAAGRKLHASRLAGLHVHFLLATANLARPGDYGTFITAAEWLDINYGSLVRQLFLGDLGGLGLHVLEPTAAPFPDAATTASIICFRVGSRPATIRMQRVASVDDLGALDKGKLVSTTQLGAARRWTPFTRPLRCATAGLVELGEICRVRRGQVTGANDFWIASEHANELPRRFLYPTVTHAKELFAAAPRLDDVAHLRRVIDLPEDLDDLRDDERAAVEAFLQKGRAAGVHAGFIASHRRAWWSVGLYEPAPILATYMARRPPAFVLNRVGARHINIAHGLYPRAPLTPQQLEALARHLTATVSVRDGRTYAGGLTKFEPKEMERLLVPPLVHLS